MKKAKPGTKVRDQLSKLTFMLQKQESLIIGIYSLLLLTVILKLTWVAILLTPIFLFSVITKDKVQLAFYLGVLSLFCLSIPMLVFASHLFPLYHRIKTMVDKNFILDMFFPKYNITNKILKNIGVIDAAREIVLHAPLVPAWEAKFRKEAYERTIHHGTHL